MIQIKNRAFVPFSIKSFTENVYSNCNIEKNKWKVTYLPQTYMVIIYQEQQMSVSL